ncbi:MAG: DUF2283 domain-containing protein [Burkholderiaceae bacterium]|nr:DUF2283 domain-containing protein [Burkholderiaceae bacterium]
MEYDPQADAMYIRLREGEVADSDEIRDGVVLDFDAAGQILGIELLSASRRTDNPQELAVTLTVRS